MDGNKKLEMLEGNIRQALDDYGAHTDNEVLGDVSDDFIERLAKDSLVAKDDLRTLFRKSPCWNEELDALVINGNRTHDPDWDYVHTLVTRMLHPARMAAFHAEDEELFNRLGKVNDLFSYPHDAYSDDEIKLLNSITEYAYHKGRKTSRIFMAICKALKVDDPTPNSMFQRTFASYADEISGRKINFKLFVSVNPAHFLTMSNPKRDARGNMLTSCHSFNSIEYDYNNGCSGYARDEVTIIAFTAADPNEPETLNNRKTTRQLFMYQPGKGILLQSRMYNSSGGTRGKQKESKVYRDLIQREISALEEVPNLWTTRTYINNEFGIRIDPGSGFGGYADWEYADFAAVISVRNDHLHDYSKYPFQVGKPGLCINCGATCSEGLCCDDCDDSAHCDCCDERFDRDYLYEVHSSDGTRYVCEECRYNLYVLCECCEEYWAEDDATRLPDGSYICPDCRDSAYVYCDECEEYYRYDNVYDAVDSYGTHINICSNCAERIGYQECEECGTLTHPSRMTEVHDENGYEIWVCDDCRDEMYEECSECEEYYHKSLMDKDGHCPDCHEALAESKGDEAV